MKKVDFICDIDDIDEYEFFFASLLPEHLLRKYAGLQAMKGGYNGVTIVSKKFKIHVHTVRKGKKELKQKIVQPVGRVRQKGGGRKKKQ